MGFDNLSSRMLTPRGRSVQGVGIKISDFKLVVDKRVYALDGRWGDLLNKIKWDLAKSVAKSAVGIQKGKIRVCPGLCCSAAA